MILLCVIDNLAACKVSVHYYYYLFQCGMEMEICSEVAMIASELTLTYIQRQRQQQQSITVIMNFTFCRPAPAAQEPRHDEL